MTNERTKIDELLKQFLLHNLSPYSSLQLVYFIAKHGASKAFMLESKKYANGGYLDADDNINVWAGQLLREIQAAIAQSENQNSKAAGGTETNNLRYGLN